MCNHRSSRHDRLYGTLSREIEGAAALGSLLYIEQNYNIRIVPFTPSLLFFILNQQQMNDNNTRILGGTTHPMGPPTSISLIIMRTNFY